MKNSISKINFSIKKEKEYNPEFIAKVLEGDKDIKAGRTIKVTLDELKSQNF